MIFVCFDLFWKIISKMVQACPKSDPIMFQNMYQINVQIENSKHLFAKPYEIYDQVNVFFDVSSKHFHWTLKHFSLFPKPIRACYFLLQKFKASSDRAQPLILLCSSHACIFSTRWIYHRCVKDYVSLFHVLKYSCHFSYPAEYVRVYTCVCSCTPC